MSDEFKNLSADELQSRAEAMLARAKEMKEQEQQKRLAELSALQAKKGELLEELKSINAQIEEMEGRVQKPTPQKQAGQRGLISKEILAYVTAHGLVPIDDLREHLDSKGLNTENLGQLVSYLKRKGELEGPKRGWYKRP